MRYYSKVVSIEAWQVLNVEFGEGARAYLLLDGVGVVVAQPAQLGNHTPVLGDYWIRLSESDQYLCPRETFVRKYDAAPELPKTGLAFGTALIYLKSGDRIARAGWNGKGMWLSYSPGSPELPAEKFWSPANRAYAVANGGSATVLPCITMKTATGEILMGWLASQTDMLAEDWMVLPE